MMKVKDKWPFSDVPVQTRHGIRKKRRRGYLSGKKTSDRGRGDSARVAQTLNCQREEVAGENASQSTEQACSGRVLRSRRYRRPFEDKPIKRLFTPEIKRFLKCWLVRRRENPYPSREEKKELSRQTALTYVQICNWFANWRRKLKNAAGGPDLQDGCCNNDTEEDRETSGQEDDRNATREGPGRSGSRKKKGRTWGNLIRRYNSRAHGNVEQFSITSDDSIWEEPEDNDVDVEEEQEEEEDMELEEGGLEEGGDRVMCPGGEQSEEDWTTVDHSYSILLERPKCRHRFPTPPDDVSDRTEGKSAERKGGNPFRAQATYPGGRKGSCEMTTSSSSSSSSSSSGSGPGDGSDCDGNEDGRNCASKKLLPLVRCRTKGSEKRSDTVSKWLESAYAFDERKMNYSSAVEATPVQLKWAARNVTWATGDTKSGDRASWILSRVGVDATQDHSCLRSVAGRHKEELDAAETLALLAATVLP